MNTINLDTITTTLKSELLHIDNKWKALIEPITLFKDAVDRVRDANGENIAIRLEDKNCLAAHNINANALRKLDKSGLQRLMGPINFVQMILGPFTGEYGEKIVQIRVPPWSVLGWQFKYFKKSIGIEETAQEYLRQKIETSLPRATATCFGGIPLFISGEGKNRGSFHRQHEFNQLIELRIGSYPDAVNLQLQSVAFMTDFVALHYFDGRKKVTSLLPLPELSIPLLKAYGVPFIPTPWFGLFLPWVKILIGSENKWHIRYRERLAIACGFLSLRDRFFMGKR